MSKGSISYNTAWGIANTAAAGAMKPEKEKLDADGAELALAIYKHMVSDQQVMIMRGLPETFFTSTTRVRASVKTKDSDCESVELYLEKSLPMPAIMTNGYPEVTDKRLGDRVRKWAERGTAYHARLRDLANSLRSRVQTARTFANLKQVWPEGAEFYTFHTTPPQPVALPAPRFDDINELLAKKRKAAKRQVIKAAA